MMTLLLAVVAAVVTASPAPKSTRFELSPSAAQALRNQLKEVNDAGLRFDGAGVVQRMYPRIVQQMGGRQKAIEAVAEVRTRTTAEGFKLLEAKIGEIESCAKMKGQLQCVVRGTMLMEIGGRRFVGQTQTLAFSDDGGKHWTFLAVTVEPSRLRSALPELCPDLPLRQQLPPEPLPAAGPGVPDR